MKMMLQRATAFLCAAAAGLALSAIHGSAEASTLFSSDMSTSAGWTVGAVSGDDIATFGYDYSADGIPAPPGGGDTIGLRLESNTTDGVGNGGVTVWSNQVFSGKYTYEFDVWGNLSFAGGTTEYYGGGIGHDQSSMMIGPGSSTSGGAGGSLVMVTDGSSSRDYRMYKDSSEQFTASGQYAVASNNGGDPAFAAISPSVDVSLPPLDVQGQAGVSDTGDPVFNWYRVKITVDQAAGTAKFELGSLELGTLDANVGSSFPLSGAAMLHHMDTFSSVASNLAFSVYDNVVVTRVPEPASVAMLGLGSLGLVLVRRRK